MQDASYYSYISWDFVAVVDIAQVAHVVFYMPS